jgi:preprotein translocase subunit SecF
MAAEKYTTTKVAKKKADTMAAKVAKDFGFNKPEPRKMSYLENLMREAKQTTSRVNNAVDKKLQSDYEQQYNRKIGNKIGSSAVKEQIGQLAGALVLGRRYDDKTGKQIKAKKK